MLSKIGVSGKNWLGDYLSSKQALYLKGTEIPIPSMPLGIEDGGAGRGLHASGPRPAPYIAGLSRASVHARTKRRDRLARPSLQTPPFLVFQRVVPLEQEVMLRKIRVSGKNQPDDSLSPKQALMLCRA